MDFHAQGNAVLDALNSRAKTIFPDGCESMTPEQILALAPDAASATAGKGLANARKWSNLGASEHAIWGECQGSGSKPYQAQIDVSEPAFKCSCPSRKFPCKHGLGLYLLFAAQKELFKGKVAPEWVEKWLESRQNRTEKVAQKAEAKAEKAADPLALAKRNANREAKVEGGLRELELWLCDLVRNGLAGLPTQPYAFWDAMGARLIDAQCPALARRVRELAGVAAIGRSWQSEFLARLGQIHLITEGWKRRDALGESLVAELRAQIGWTLKEDELDESAAVEDEWWVLAQRSEEDGQLRLVKSYLWGQTSRRVALFLQFGHVSQPLAPGFVPLTRLRARAIFYPGAAPLRATFRDKSAVSPLHGAHFDFATSIGAASASYSQMLAQNPWLEALPVALGSVSLGHNEANWLLRDEQGDEWPVSPFFDRQWELLSASGGAPTTLFGEWDGRMFRPLQWNFDGEKMS